MFVIPKLFSTVDDLVTVSCADLLLAEVVHLLRLFVVDLGVPWHSQHNPDVRITHDFIKKYPAIKNTMTEQINVLLS